MEEKNTLLIVGVVLCVLLPPIGIIICLICLNDIKKNNKEGKNLAVNGLMVGVLMTIAFTAGTIFLVVHHNNKVEEQEKREKYERELKKLCDEYGDSVNYDSYDKDHPNQRFIQCHSGDCYMYKDGKTLASYYCSLG